MKVLEKENRMLYLINRISNGFIQDIDEFCVLTLNDQRMALSFMIPSLYFAKTFFNGKASQVYINAIIQECETVLAHDEIYLADPFFNIVITRELRNLVEKSHNAIELAVKFCESLDLKRLPTGFCRIIAIAEEKCRDVYKMGETLKTFPAC